MSARSQAEEHFVEAGDEAEPRVVQERLDERAADGVFGARAGPVAVEEGAKRGDEILPLRPVLAEEDGGAHGGCPRSLVTPEERLERLA